MAGIARVPFVVGIDRYLPAAFGKIHPRWKTPWISILVQAGLSGAILLMSQIKSKTVIEAYQLVVDAAIILYFIPFLYMFAAVVKLAYRKERSENAHAVLIPGGMAGVWLCGSLGFIVILIGIALSMFFPPSDVASKPIFEMKLIGGTLASILLGLILYWRGARSRQT